MALTYQERIKKKINSIVRSSLNLTPDFIIIGAQKSGTTSLFNMMCKHPRITRAAEKELHFFDLKYDYGPKWYFSNFPIKYKSITGEATPYYLFHPLVPERVKQLLPNIKLIILLRNPIDRAYSQFHMQKRIGIENAKSFEEAVHRELKWLETESEYEIFLRSRNLHQNFLYLERGKYYAQLSSWLKHYTLKDMIIIESNEFFNSPARQLSSVYKFLFHSKNDYLSEQDSIETAPSKYPSISNETRHFLNEYFKEENCKLYDLLRRDFQWQ
jgi:hypothetical protein